jgi:hypothetical protein
MRAFSWKGVVLGGITDIVATNIAAFPLAIVAAVGTDLTSLPKAERGKALVAVMHASLGFQMTGLVLGAMCSVLGGYVAARIAKRGELLNGALSAYLCIGIGVYSVIVGHSATPLWQQLVAFVGSPILGAYGGYLWVRQANRALNATDTLAQPA